MDGNSLKPAETLDVQVSALRAIRTWLEREGGNRKIPLVLDLMAEQSVSLLLAGHSLSGIDADTLRKFYFDKHGGRPSETEAARWLPSTRVTRWWEERQEQVDNACREAGLTVAPSLLLQPGGGRGNPTQYRFEFRAVPASADGAPEVPSSIRGEDATEVIRYVIEPAKAAWWLHLLIGTEPFRMRSWRGIGLLGLVLAEGLLLTLLWVAVLLAMKSPRPIVSSDVFNLILTLFLSAAWWRWLRPLVRLPQDRVTIATDLYLSWNQFYGQFRLTRDAKSKLAGGWFRLVRHWAYCPICSGEVEILPGGEAFPGRLVGRCSDSPLEHVFSFDPVNLCGAKLRHG